MEGYKKCLKEEAEEFRKTGKRFLDGELSKMEFKKMSGGMGCYAQRDGKHFMIRLRTPSGVISLPHFKLILGYAEKYGLDKIHITTRQAVQLHDLTIDQVCDIMSDAIDHDLFTRGGGGNFPRNVSLSPMAGADKGELFDVTPYALMVNDYFVRNATGYKLPRKMKVSFSSGSDDTAFATINDMGFMASENNGELCFQLWLAGGMGGGPAVGLPFDEPVKPEEALYYVEAMVRLFMAEGDYEHRAKARIRFIPRRMGVEAFMDCYKGYVKQVKEECKLEEITPKPVEAEDWEPELAPSEVVIPQRQKGRYTVVLHPVCGQMTLSDAEELDRFLDTCDSPQLRLGMLEDLFVRNLTKEETEKLLTLMEGTMKRTKIDMSVSCVGTPTCQIGILESRRLCHAIIDKVEESGVERSFLPRVCISGCPNSCSRHQVAELGFAGKIKPVDGQKVDVFDCFTGGVVSRDKTAMGENLGTIPAVKIPEMIVELGTVLERADMDYRSYTAEHMDEVKELIGKYVV